MKIFLNNFLIFSSRLNFWKILTSSVQKNINFFLFFLGSTTLFSVKTTNFKVNKYMSVNALLSLIRRCIQNLNTSERYALLIGNHELLLILISSVSGGSIKKIAEWLELEETMMEQIIVALPLTYQQIGLLLKQKLDLKVSPQSIYKLRKQAIENILKAIADHEDKKVRGNKKPS
jgi:hypothetical protein